MKISDPEGVENAVNIHKFHALWPQMRRFNAFGCAQSPLYTYSAPKTLGMIFMPEVTPN
jgi:hypothetical protein